MKVLSIILVACGALCVLSGTSAVSEETPLKLTIESKQSALTLGSEIHVTAALTNESDHAIQLTKMVAAGVTSYDYQVNMWKDNGGGPVKKHAEKLRQNEVGSEAMAPGAGSIVFVTLTRGETREDDIELTHRYVLSSPGEYFVQVQREIPSDLGGGILKSNIIKLVIK